MKQRKWRLIFAVIPLVALFLWAREAASWRPIAISEKEFRARATILISAREWRDPEQDGHAVLTPQQKRLKKKLRDQGWQAHALSPDKTRLLAENLASGDAAIFHPSDGRALRIIPATKKLGGGSWLWWGWSSDGKIVWFARGEDQPIELFDARTGEHLWNCEWLNTAWTCSPDGQVFADQQDDAISVWEAKTGRLLKKFNFPNATDEIYFTHDSQHLLLAVAPSQYRQMRLR